MGKKGGSSWLTVVKRAFRSPSKDNQIKTSRRSREENDQEQDEEEKKREKRRWLFRKPSNNNATQSEIKLTKSYGPPNKTPEVLPPDHRHAIAVAAATAAAAEAAVVTAQAAVEIFRLTRSSNPNPSSFKQNYACIIIQKAFRGYLARRALVALRGIVKLQALIRGQNVRKQAKMTLRCMQALLRLQSRIHDHHHQARLSHDGGSRKSMFAETTNLWESKYLGDIRERKSISKDRLGSNTSIDWNEYPRKLEELEEVLKSKRAASLAHAFSQKIWNPDKEELGLGERTNWLDQWMTTRQCKNDEPLTTRVSTDKRDSYVKTVEMDRMPKQYSSQSHSATPANVRKFHHQINPHQKQSPHSAASPGRLKPTHNFSVVQPPLTPSPSSKSKPVPVQTPSPRSLNKEDKSYSAANTPSLKSMQRLNSSISSYYSSASICSNEENGITMPNYMAATESTKARVRSQSAPRQRPSTPERERGGGVGASLAKKRLSYPVPPAEEGPGYACCNNSSTTMSYSESLRSPSFKSVQQWNQSCSCYTDSIGGEISPCSTTELRRLLG